MSGFNVPGATGAGYGYDVYTEPEPDFPVSYDRPFPPRKVMKIDELKKKKNKRSINQSMANAALNAAAEAAVKAMNSNKANKSEESKVESTNSKNTKNSKKEYFSNFRENFTNSPYDGLLGGLTVQDLVFIFIIFVIVVMLLSIYRTVNQTHQMTEQLYYLILMSVQKNK